MTQSDGSATGLTSETVERLDDFARSRWNSVVEQASLGSVFHRHEWLTAVESGTELESKHVVVFKGENPVAVFPNFVVDIDGTPLRRLVSPDPGYGGPVILSDETACLRRIYRAVSTICGDRVISHHISPPDLGYVRYHSSLEERGYRPTITGCRFLLDLTSGWEELHAGMDRSRRRRMSGNRDAPANVADRPVTPETMNEFYDRYTATMDRVGGVPRSRDLFSALVEMADRVKIPTLTVDGVDAGMHLYLLDDERSGIYHLFSGITEDDFEHNPSETLHEHAIKWGIENGYETYDFGETWADFDDGLFRFKEQFGGTAVPAISWRKGYSKVLWSLYRAGKSLHRRLDSE